MTRKQALLQAIKELSSKEEFSETVRLLQDIHNELPLIHWTDKSIRDTVDQFILENGRVPTVTDFKKKGMPPHPVIKQKYNTTLGEWLNKNYPTQKPTRNELKEKYVKQFVEEYLRIKPTTQYQFNINKNKKTKSWLTVAKYCGITSWRKLIEINNLPYYAKVKPQRLPTKISVNIISDYDFTEDL